jgi:hypothetical protein
MPKREIKLNLCPQQLYATDLTINDQRVHFSKIQIEQGINDKQNSLVITIPLSAVEISITDLVGGNKND